jgi:DnaK suppressor protein
MDEKRARERLLAERADLLRMLERTEEAGQESQTQQEGPGDIGDVAQPLTSEATAGAIAAHLRERLAAIDRALRRLDDGTYGRSVRSGRPIPDERLEADPAAELTVEEAKEDSRT